MRVPQWLFELATFVVGLVVAATLYRSAFPVVGALLGGAASVFCIRGLKQRD